MNRLAFPNAVSPILAAAVCSVVSLQVYAQAPLALPPGKSSSDSRLGELKTLNGHFPFRVPDTAGDWYSRAERLKKQVLIANGLLPMPEKAPLNAVVHGKVSRPGFTVERVYFQSLPGHFVTGLLFRPDKPSQTPRPGVLSPHGHGGRQQTHNETELKRQLANGAEHYAKSGSMPKLARCATLARMGCVTFIFDMLGYADSIQIPREVAHRHAEPRPEEKRVGLMGDWTFYSAQADLRLQTVMGLQTWNAIRALDFLESLPDVDPERLAVTGGSGGGTQSILLGAIDDRIKVSFPNGMVSTSMQGGCYCENCNLLRVGTGNVELAALFAPRPQAMTAANDWTKKMMEDGYPELRWLYAMIGNEEDVYCRPMLHFKHNYNYVTRMTMYQWMNKHLNLGLDVPVIETDFEPLTAEETAVWNEEHPAPKNVGPDHEREICKWWESSARVALMNSEKNDRSECLNGPMPIVFGIDPIPALVGFAKNTPVFKATGETMQESLSVKSGLLTNPQRRTELPILLVRGKDAPENGKVIVWTRGDGKAAAFANDAHSIQTLRKLASQATVILPDLYCQGELRPEKRDHFPTEGSEKADGKGAVDVASVQSVEEVDSDEPTQTKSVSPSAPVLSQQRLVDDKRSYSAFTFGYNKTIVAHRVSDLIDVVAFANQTPNSDVRLLATDRSGAWAVAAAAMVSKSQLRRSMIDMNGFRFDSASSYRDIAFVPGAAKYGGATALAEMIEGESRVINQGVGIEAILIGEKDKKTTVRSEWPYSPNNINWLTR